MKYRPGLGRLQEGLKLCLERAVFDSLDLIMEDDPLKLSEAEVQAHILEAGMEALTRHEPDLEVEVEAGKADDEEASFELWRLVKAKALSKLDRLHTSIRYGQFIGSALRLPSGSTHMELDILGTHEDGVFVLELKVNKTAERQAFSELLAYSNYIANVFACRWV